MTKSIIVTGATGKQGGAVVDALVALPNAADFSILAVTRDTSSSSAQKLAAKSASVKLVKGDLDDASAIFDEAVKVSDGPVWGVYSVQVSMGTGVTFDREVAQGKGLIDEAVKRKVRHFVYSSVERGGDEKSWEDPTPVPHFRSKHEIELHLREKAGDMGWTILRPVAFMDNLTPGFQSKVFVTSLHNWLGDDKPLQWVAVSDIGHFAAQAFSKPDDFNRKAVGLAGDELTVPQLNEAFERTTGAADMTTFSLLGSALTFAMAEMGAMIKWFASDGYGVDIAHLRKTNPRLRDMETWLREESDFATKN